jgi:type III pantothenate kinase
MHEFTGKLPLLDKRDKTDLIGKNSHQSMHSGVINGIQKELEGFITEYRNRYADLTFFITGGDAVYFDFEGKSDIFAVENLTLEGMYTIYSFNAK